ncbi:MAG: long-chain fatty acid--CoA ligase [Chloroflexi bacterium]|nr:MAG: long-chain fatty acid--CoA ligase [Chloroflexota bacterium]
MQLERHRAVNRAIERFIEGRQQSSWRELETRAGHLTERRPWLAHYGPNIPLTVPIPRQPLHRFLESAADWAPRRTALVFYRIRYTYRQLNMLANQFAHTLHGMGVQPGDRVLLVLPNIPQLVVAYYATLKIGGVAVLPGPEMDVSLLTRQAQETRPKVLVALREAVDLVEAVRALDDPPQVVLTGIRQAAGEAVYHRLLARWGLAPDRAAPDSAGLSMAELMADASPLSPGITVRPDALAAVLYTSGTEGLPKGVKLTHANLVANTMQTRHWLQELEYGREVCLSVVPLTHSYGMTNAMNAPVALAATLVLLPGFELDEVLQHIKKYRPTLFPGVPAMYTAINQAPNVRSYGLHSIKACVSGAAPLPVEVQEAFEKLTRGRLVEGYGLTEASPVTHANPLYGVRKVGSIGVPIPNTDARIVDLTTGQDLPPGQIGELVVKGPQVMPGYWNDEPATRQVLRDGWLHTGDVAVMDAEGYFTIINRRQEIIEVDGQWVFPRDVEEVLYEHSKVLEAAAVGVTVEENGRPATRVRAFVVPRPGEHISPEELLALCRRRLEPHAVPREIVLREELPKSFVGKILRTKLGGD